MVDLKPEMKCKVLADTPFVSKDATIVIDKDSTGDIIVGKTGMIFCRVPQGGSLFFEESNLEIQ